MSTLNARAGWGNLNGQNLPGNSVLFGNEGSSGSGNGMATRYGGSYNSRGSSRNPDAGIITTGVYELDVGNQWAQTQSDRSDIEADKIVPGTGRDLESGIVVRTVVDTLADPVPGEQHTRTGSRH
ncbi:hypothetical protein VKT23_007450 [Stygiomarasmius scandens]|uniref:Uncharacterized protein n=1 Tax=Marasmiellus scandens TaxID=2682957 RepID=A0ABR1JQD1_9AGAR